MGNCCWGSLKHAQSKLFLSQVKERPDVGVYIKDLSAYVVNNADDMDRIMTLGHKNRTQPCCEQVYSSGRMKSGYETAVRNLSPNA